MALIVATLTSQISAGELVVDHGDSNALEQQLETIFKIAKHFNAVLLLDEADAFMEQRTSYHDTHNRLVTVFLRKLEYYPGILFLTSNRGIQFDDAILSRIYFNHQVYRLEQEISQGTLVSFSDQGTYSSRTCRDRGARAPTIGVFRSQWTRGGFKGAAVHFSLTD